MKMSTAICGSSVGRLAVLPAPELSGLVPDVVGSPPVGELLDRPVMHVAPADPAEVLVGLLAQVVEVGLRDALELRQSLIGVHCGFAHDSLPCLMSATRPMTKMMERTSTRTRSQVGMIPSVIVEPAYHIKRLLSTASFRLPRPAATSTGRSA